MSHVAAGVDGGSAGVPLDVAAFEGDELFLNGGITTTWLVRLFLRRRPVMYCFYMVENSEL
jgi:hypothetical protein